MTWRIVYHETQPERPRVGDCWSDAELIEGENRDHMREHFLAPEYFEKHYGRRAPLWVLLPDKTYFCVDSRVVSSSEVGDHGWTVTGEPWHGNLTVSPSINIVGSYHGHIKNNEITDDVEGRKFPHADVPEPAIESERAESVAPFWIDRASSPGPFWKKRG
jgi:hypothetical protein